MEIKRSIDMEGISTHIINTSTPDYFNSVFLRSNSMRRIGLKVSLTSHGMARSPPVWRGCVKGIEKVCS